MGRGGSGWCSGMLAGTLSPPCLGRPWDHRTPSCPTLREGPHMYTATPHLLKRVMRDQKAARGTSLLACRVAQARGQELPLDCGVAGWGIWAGRLLPATQLVAFQPWGQLGGSSRADSAASVVSIARSGASNRRIWSCSVFSLYVERRGGQAGPRVVHSRDTQLRPLSTVDKSLKLSGLCFSIRKKGERWRQCLSYVAPGGDDDQWLCRTFRRGTIKAD